MSALSGERRRVIGRGVHLLLVVGGLTVATSGGSPARGSAVPRPAIAWSPDGRLLALGGYQRAELVEARSGKWMGSLEGHAGAITSVAFSPDGKWLAVAGGVPGRSGEIRLWSLATRTARIFSGLHGDVVYSVAWSPDGKTLAAGSYDRFVSLWDVASGKPRRLKDHTDAVYSVAWSPDGKRIASASGDRTVKVWDAASAKRVFTLSEATAELYTVAFHPSGKELAAAGVDKMLRKWIVTATGGSLSRSAFAHDGPVVRLVYLPDGSAVFTSSEDRSIKLWDSLALTEKSVLEKQPDLAMGMALSPDGKSLAVSRYDGSAAVYDVATGQRRLTVKDEG